jgi:predicted RNA binding protein YcfA (HicA-like mRNA interferase family)
MSTWGARKAKLALAALLRIGWRVKRQSGSHRVLARDSIPTTYSHFMTAKKSGRACCLG